MRLRASTMALAAALLALGACGQSPDVGQPCTISWGTGDTAPPPPDPVTLYAEPNHGGQWFETGNTQCENLVCIVSPEPAGARYSSGGYCSKPCVSDGDCFPSQTGLACRQIVLDAAFIQELQTANPTLYSTYLGDIKFSSYCVAQ
jgi:hypothetical protein